MNTGDKTVSPEMWAEVDAAVASRLKELEGLAGERQDVLALHLLDAINAAAPRSDLQTTLMYLLDAHLAGYGETAGSAAVKPLVMMKLLLISAS